jgi:hypothetical protein
MFSSMEAADLVAPHLVLFDLTGDVRLPRDGVVKIR